MGVKILLHVENGENTKKQDKREVVRIQKKQDKREVEESGKRKED